VVDRGRPWSTVVDRGRPWSTVVDLGQPWSTVVDRGFMVKRLVWSIRSIWSKWCFWLTAVFWVVGGLPWLTVVDRGRPRSFWSKKVSLVTKVSLVNKVSFGQSGLRGRPWSIVFDRGRPWSTAADRGLSGRPRSLWSIAIVQLALGNVWSPLSSLPWRQGQWDM